VEVGEDTGDDVSWGVKVEVAVSGAVSVDVTATAGVGVAIADGVKVRVGIAVRVGVGVSGKVGGMTSIGSPGRTMARQLANKVSETPLPCAATSPLNTIKVATLSSTTISNSVSGSIGETVKSVTKMRNSKGTSMYVPRA
jgi:hypothetical protein